MERMQQRLLLFPVFLLFAFTAAGQTVPDSVRTHGLKEVTVRAYLQEQPLLRTPSSVSVIGSEQMYYQPGNSLLPVMNTVPGVRMEERSPGSYRLSIRGSLLRSPFGIRNVKIYIDDFPLTDAGGNTYLNLLDVGSIREIEILKGPDGSLFGANSGGVVLLRTMQPDTSGHVKVEAEGGMYGLFRQKAEVKLVTAKNVFHLTEAYQRSSGYRENSGLQRLYIQAGNDWSYSPVNRLRALVFYSDLSYRTPGGLTLEQFTEDPRQARPPTATLPGATEQKAGVFNKTLFAGISHEAGFLRRMRHVVALSGSYTSFQNPFITNYEMREEFTYGLRTYFELGSKPVKRTEWKFHLGAEWQNTHSGIRNYDNEAGAPGELQAASRLLTMQYFFFTRFSVLFFKKLTLESAVSLNQYGYVFPGDSAVSRRFDLQPMPRIAASWLVTRYLSLRASVSRGYSPPATAEVRPSDNQIYAGLQPETGWNYEGGVRIDLASRFTADVSAFHYRMENAIVRRLNDNGTEYFVNAGGTDQTGLESQMAFWIIRPSGKGIVRGLQLHNSYTLSFFTFRDYSNDTISYSGNDLTGVPRHIVITDATLHFAAGFYFFAEHNYTSSLPLNDANTAYANDYHLVRIKAGWRSRAGKGMKWELFAGVDNLLNQKYSLGNDLNAAGNRYYNAAAPVNFYAGARLSVQYARR